MKKAFAICAVFVFSTFLYGEPINVETCIEEAIKNSEAIKGQKAAIEASASDVKSTMFNYYPTAKISYKYMKLAYNNEPDPIVLPFEPPVEFEIPLPGWQNNVEASIVQPITSLWVVYKGYSAKKLVNEIEHLKLSLDSNQLRLKIIEFYNSYFMLEEAVRLLDQTTDYLKKYKEIAASFVKEEMTDKRAVLKIDIELERVQKEQRNITGQQSVIKTAISLFIDREENSFTLEPEKRKPAYLSKSYKEIIEIQESFRPEIKMLEKTDAIAENISDISLHPFIPNLALVSGYKHDFEATSFSPKGVFYFGGALEWGIGFDFVSNYYKHNKAKAEMIKTKFNNVESKKQMILQVRSLYEEILVKESEIDLSKKEITEAKENLRIEESKYKEKMTTETDLLNALLSLKKATTSLTTACYQHQTALNKLAVILGVNLEEITKNKNNQEKGGGI